MKSFEEFSTHPSENAYLNAARDLDIPFRPVQGEYRFWLLGDERHFVVLYRAMLGVVPETLSRFIRDKAASQGWLQRRGLPVPEFLFTRLGGGETSKLEAICDFAENRFPVVVKPNGLAKATGVFTDIRDEAELMRALGLQLRANRYDLMVEQFVEGMPHRAIVFDREVLDVTYWTHAGVTGDGESSIRGLIESLNERETGFEPVSVDARLIDTLDKQNLRLGSVVDAGRTVRVVEAGIRRGSRRHRVPLEELPKENIELFQDVWETIGSRLLGIDFVCRDARKCWRDQPFAINEVNASPGFGLLYPGTEDNDYQSVYGVLRRFFA